MAADEGWADVVKALLAADGVVAETSKEKESWDTPLCAATKEGHQPGDEARHRGE